MVEDSKTAWEDYKRLGFAGGSRSYPVLLKLASLSLAYEAGSVANATEYAKEVLNEYIAKESLSIANK
mgnify:CR=1 FL=1